MGTNGKSKTPPQFGSLRSMIKAIKKHRIEDGNVVVVKSGSAIAERMGEFEQAIRQVGLHDILLIVADDVSDLSVLNEAALNRAGWFKIKHLARIIHKQNVQNG